MKVKVRKIISPKMPTSHHIKRFCRSLSSDESECALLECCIALSLAIAPDNERSFYTVYGYACHFSDGFTQNTLEAVRMWASGELSENTVSEIPDAILDNFRRSYLFRWQRRLIEYALERYDFIQDKAAELYPSCCSKLCTHALNGTLILRSLNL